MVNLGELYFYQDGVVPQDYAKAAEWFKKAADRGNPNALYYLYLMYGAGAGVPKNELEAATYCLRAAERGHKKAIEVVNRFDPRLLEMVKSEKSLREQVDDLKESVKGAAVPKAVTDFLTTLDSIVDGEE